MHGIPLSTATDKLLTQPIADLMEDKRLTEMGRDYRWFIEEASRVVPEIPDARSPSSAAASSALWLKYFVVSPSRLKSTASAQSEHQGRLAVSRVVE